MICYGTSTMEQVPAGYEPFEIVEHRREIDAAYSPFCLAVKIREDDIASWALHGWLRSQLARTVGATPPAMAAPTPRAQLPPPPSPNAQAVGRALLAHADALAAELAGGTAQFTPNPAANAMIHEDAFAFLLAVIADMGIRAERAWALPFELSMRLGGLSPARLREDPAAVRTAVQRQPMLHRFVNVVPDWFVQAAGIVLEHYGGEPSGCGRTSPLPSSCAVAWRRSRASARRRPRWPWRSSPGTFTSRFGSSAAAMSPTTSTCGESSSEPGLPSGTRSATWSLSPRLCIRNGRAPLTFRLGTSGAGGAARPTPTVQPAPLTLPAPG